MDKKLELVPVPVTDVDRAKALYVGVDVQQWGHFVYFSDPDGNTWALQQLPAQG